MVDQCAAGDTFPATTVTVTGSGQAVVSGIPSGLSCSATEDGFSVSPLDSTVSATPVLVPGTITFTNTKRAPVTLVKTQNGVAPTYVYTFTLSGGPDSISVTRSTTAGSLTPLDFGLVKPGTYTVCEVGVAAGTTSSIQSWPGATIDATAGTICAPVTVEAGVALQLAVDNVVGEGGRRMIGYWKNWNTCTSNAGQLANAAKTGKTLMDTQLPITLGSFTVTTCKSGVAVLSNASAKYAENALAAQLLAAKLNVSVAGASPEVMAMIAHADALLTQIGYAGPPSTIVGSTYDAAIRADVVATAAWLDQFNNGLRGDAVNSTTGCAADAVNP